MKTQSRAFCCLIRQTKTRDNALSLGIMAVHSTIQILIFTKFLFLPSFVSQSFGLLRWRALVVGLLSIYCPLLASAKTCGWAFMLKLIYQL